MTGSAVRRRVGAGAVLAAVVTGCAPGDSIGPRSREAAGPGGGAAPTVTTFNPKEGEQGVTLDLFVTGTGYNSTSSASLLLNGKPTPKVRTNSTTLVPGSTTELVANITIAVDAVVADYEVQVANAGGKKGIGIEKFAVTLKINPQDLPATADIPVPTAEDGFFSDGGGTYLESMNADLTMRVMAYCAMGRLFDLVLPAEWSALVPAGATAHCTSPFNEDTHSALMGLRFGACPDGTSCPMGTTGHDPTAISFSPDLRYVWRVDVPRPRGKGTGVLHFYNVVWIDGTYRVTRWAGGIANGTPCAWQLNGSTAEFWRSTPSLLRLEVNRPMELDVAIARGDAVCT